MGYESIKANTEKSRKGNLYEKYLYEILEENLKLYGINSLEKQHIECGMELSDSLYVKLSLLEKTKEITEKDIIKLVSQEIELQKNSVIRTKQKYNKRSDIRFKTNNSYIDSKGNLRPMEIIIDSTTTSRGDRIKGKANDASVYYKNGIEGVYIIVLPNDEYFDKFEYDDPEKEKKCCNQMCYEHNFENRYKEEKVSLILREDDLFNFLTYIKKRKNQSMDKLIENFKKYQFPDQAKQRKEAIKILKETLIEEMKNEFL